MGNDALKLDKKGGSVLHFSHPIRKEFSMRLPKWLLPFKSEPYSPPFCVEERGPVGGPTTNYLIIYTQKGMFEVPINLYQKESNDHNGV